MALLRQVDPDLGLPLLVVQNSTVIDARRLRRYDRSMVELELDPALTRTTLGWQVWMKPGVRVQAWSNEPSQAGLPQPPDATPAWTPPPNIRPLTYQDVNAAMDIPPGL